MLSYVSKGTLFNDEVSREASNICSLIDTLAQERESGQDTSFSELKSILEKEVLANADHQQQLIVDVNGRYVKTRRLLLHLQATICGELRIQISPQFVSPIVDGVTNQRQSDWYGLVHPAILNQIDDEFAKSMTIDDTITIVADIRRSQDLMTYSSPSYYNEKIIEFTENVKSIILENNGVFDKFTGDGFIAYFNKHMCDTIKADYYNQMWMACVRIMEFATPFFDGWCKKLRKIPDEKIGLSIGVDSGTVEFTTLDHQVYAVGEPCVWATRMNSAGKSGEFVFNNIPYNHMVANGLELNFREEDSHTKTGEKFKCYKVFVNSHTLSKKGSQIST